MRRCKIAIFLFCLASFLSEFSFIYSADASQILVNFDTEAVNARNWLQKNGFDFELDGKNERAASLVMTARGLVIETLRPAEPIIALRNLHLDHVSRLTIEWGVQTYPTGANWERGVHNEPIMVIVFFGNEKLSGGLFLPPSPYFIGFFLCGAGSRNTMLTGRSYAAQGRYVCVDSPAAGATIRSEINVAAAFREAFSKSLVPPVTAIAIEADTTSSGNRGASAAWIKSITYTPGP